MENLENLKYPIGHFITPGEITKAHIDEWINTLENFPQRLISLVQNLKKEQLDTPYREGGWTVRQVIHHIADSHHHSYTRFKWTLTEDSPIIKAYDEKGWSTIFDAKTAPIDLSLSYLVALHAKLVFLLKGLSESQLQEFFIHPDGNTKVTLQENIGRYAWHGNHHFAHIKNLIAKMQW